MSSGGTLTGCAPWADVVALVEFFGAGFPVINGQYLYVPLPSDNLVAKCHLSTATCTAATTDTVSAPIGLRWVSLCVLEAWSAGTGGRHALT